MVNLTLNPVGIYEKAFPDSLSWEDRLREAGNAGYDFLEMSIDDTEARLARLEWSPAERRALRRTMETTEMPILTMGVSGHRKFPLGSPSSELRARGLEIFRQAIELASDLDIRLIQLMGYDVYDETSDADTRARFIEGLRQGARWASAAGVMLGLENVDVDTVDCVEKALYYINKVNSPWLNVYPDMGNMVAAGYNPVDQLKLGKAHLVGIHVKDALPGEVRGVVFESGDVAFSNVFQVLAELDFSGPAVVEMWAHLDKTGDPTRAAAEACQMVRRQFREAAGARN